MFDELTQNHRLVLQTLGCSERHERRENEECSIPWFQRIVVKRGKMLKLHFYLFFPFLFSFQFLRSTILTLACLEVGGWEIYIFDVSTRCVIGVTFV
jgi:hypothetical protein